MPVHLDNVIEPNSADLGPPTPPRNGMDGSHRLNWIAHGHQQMPCATQASEPALERVIDLTSGTRGRGLPARSSTSDLAFAAAVADAELR